MFMNTLLFMFCMMKHLCAPYRKALESDEGGDNSWVVLTFHGYENSPISFKEHLHAKGESGDIVLTIVLCAGAPTLVFNTVGDLDTFQ
eukprot:m.64707 g.64707  ORF g.64707 m.64707 type:complete len:88 (-) comp8122_c0_seq9:108-371(-)